MVAGKKLFIAPAAAAALLLALALAGCDQAKEAAREQYYKALERVGLEKREVLVSRVDKARESQDKAQKQFKDALEELRALAGYKGGELEAKYEKLNKEYESAVSRADDVNDKIRGVKHVAESLFKEWQAEIGQYEDQNLRRQSEAELKETQHRYAQLVVVMDKAAARMDPVLRKLHDQVLFLKHNLNAKVLGSLGGTADKIQVDVTKLVEDMEASIREADAFIKDMGTQKE